MRKLSFFQIGGTYVAGSVGRGGGGGVITDDATTSPTPTITTTATTTTTTQEGGRNTQLTTATNNNITFNISNTTTRSKFTTAAATAIIIGSLGGGGGTRGDAGGRLEVGGGRLVQQIRGKSKAYIQRHGSLSQKAERRYQDVQNAIREQKERALLKEQEELKKQQQQFSGGGGNIDTSGHSSPQDDRQQRGHPGGGYSIPPPKFVPPPVNLERVIEDNIGGLGVPPPPTQFEGFFSKVDKATKHQVEGSLTIEHLTGVVPDFFVPIKAVLAELPGYTSEHVNTYFKMSRSLQFMDFFYNGNVEKYVRLFGDKGSITSLALSGEAAEKYPMFRPNPELAEQFVALIRENAPGAGAKWISLQKLIENTPEALREELPLEGPSSLLFFGMFQHRFNISVEDGGGVCLAEPDKVALDRVESPCAAALNQVVMHLEFEKFENSGIQNNRASLETRKKAFTHLWQQLEFYSKKQILVNFGPASGFWHDSKVLEQDIEDRMKRYRQQPVMQTSAGLTGPKMPSPPVQPPGGTPPQYQQQQHQTPEPSGFATGYPTQKQSEGGYGTQNTAAAAYPPQLDMSAMGGEATVVVNAQPTHLPSTDPHDSNNIDVISEGSVSVEVMPPTPYGGAPAYQQQQGAPAQYSMPSSPAQVDVSSQSGMTTSSNNSSSLLPVPPYQGGGVPAPPAPATFQQHPYPPPGGVYNPHGQMYAGAPSSLCAPGTFAPQDAPVFDDNQVVIMEPRGPEDVTPDHARIRLWRNQAELSEPCEKHYGYLDELAAAAQSGKGFHCGDSYDPTAPRLDSLTDETIARVLLLFVRAHHSVLYSEGSYLMTVRTQERLARKEKPLKEQLREALRQGHQSNVRKIRKRIAVSRNPNNPLLDLDRLAEACHTFLPKSRHINFKNFLHSLPDEIQCLLPERFLLFFGKYPKLFSIFELHRPGDHTIQRVGLPLPDGILRDRYQPHEIAMMVAQTLEKAYSKATLGNCMRNLPRGAQKQVQGEYGDLVGFLKEFPDNFGLTFAAEGQEGNLNLTMVILLKTPGQ